MSRVPGRYHRGRPSRNHSDDLVARLSVLETAQRRNDAETARQSDSDKATAHNKDELDRLELVKIKSTLQMVEEAFNQYNPEGIPDVHIAQWRFLQALGDDLTRMSVKISAYSQVCRRVSVAMQKDKERREPLHEPIELPTGYEERPLPFID